MLLGVMREAGELDSGASSVAAAPETAGLSCEYSVDGTDRNEFHMVLCQFVLPAFVC